MSTIPQPRETIHLWLKIIYNDLGHGFTRLVFRGAFYSKEKKILLKDCNNDCSSDSRTCGIRSLKRNSAP